MTQKEKILDYLLAYDHITAFEAVVNLHITRLAARIAELIEDGVPIVKVWTEITNGETGETTRYIEYRLLPDYAEEIRKIRERMKEDGK